jgi:hypothetical protein
MNSKFDWAGDAMRRVLETRPGELQGIGEGIESYREEE